MVGKGRYFWKFLTSLSLSLYWGCCHMVQNQFWGLWFLRCFPAPTVRNIKYRYIQAYVSILFIGTCPYVESKPSLDNLRYLYYVTNKKACHHNILPILCAEHKWLTLHRDKDEERHKDEVSKVISKSGQATSNDMSGSISVREWQRPPYWSHKSSRSDTEP